MKNKRRKLKTDYQAKNLRNPFFYNRKKDIKGGKRWLFLLAIVGLFGLIWFFLGSSVWKIENIEIVGLNRVSNDRIISIIKEREVNNKMLFFKESNIFLMNKDDLTQDILGQYNFANLKIDKKLPNTIKVVISERPYSFIFQEGSDMYYASREGYIIKDENVKDEDRNKYFILENKSDSVSINSKGKINLNEEYLNFVFSLSENLSLYSDLNPEKYIVEQELNSLIVDFAEGPIVYFNIKNDPIVQVENLALVKREKIRDNFNTVEYIDMRYGDRMFIN